MNTFVLLVILFVAGGIIIAAVDIYRHPEKRKRNLLIEKEKRSQQLVDEPPMEDMTPDEMMSWMESLVQRQKRDED